MTEAPAQSPVVLYDYADLDYRQHGPVSLTPKEWANHVIKRGIAFTRTPAGGFEI
jgi:hypothetical protein